jgi:hypothetical protein
VSYGPVRKVQQVKHLLDRSVDVLLADIAPTERLKDLVCRLPGGADGEIGPIRPSDQGVLPPQSAGLTAGSIPFGSEGTLYLSTSSKQVLLAG